MARRRAIPAIVVGLRAGTPVALRVAMRSLAVLAVLSQLAQAAPRAVPNRRPDEPPRAVAPVPVDESSMVESLPGGREVLGCHKYPRDKKFRWGVRG